MKPKIAIFVQGGMVQGVRCSVPIDLMILDADLMILNADGEYIDKEDLEQEWEELQTQLEFGY